MTTPARLRHVDAAIVRISLFAPATGLPPWPDLTGNSAAHVADQVAWLRRVWADEAFADAVGVASPDLADSVADLLAGLPQHPRRIRGTAESTLRYLLRATSRATPFGLFAGVAAARVGAPAALEWGSGHRVTARPDAAWLTALITHLEARSDLRPHLHVVANTLARQGGDRLVIPCRLRSGDTAPSDVTIRNRAAVQTVMQAARAPITIAELTRLLASGLPGHPVADIETMLATLVEHGVLVSSLHPPMDECDPLTHVITRLAALGPHAPVDVLGQLQTIRDELAQHRRSSTPEERRALRASATKRMAALHDTSAPKIAVDVRLDCRTLLPTAVACEAEAAATVLVRLSPHPHGNPSWRAWHTAFLERWGIGAVVPLADVVNADTGLGYPAGYRTSHATAPAQPLTGRDRALLRLAQQATLDGSEIVLDEKLLDKLVVDSNERWPPHPVPHTELRFALHAPTTEAIDRGSFTLIVVSAARQAGTTAGRFLHLLTSADRDRMMHVLTALPTRSPGATLAQVCCPPLSPRAANLARSPAIALPIPLGEHRDPTVEHLPVQDLAVSCDAHHLFLLSLSRGEIVEPLAVNALDFRRATHPLARLLCEIATARAAACVPFSWGAVGGLPFLPRVRYGRTVLHPATWNLVASDLPVPTAGWPEWEQEWADLRARCRVPGQVFLGDSDVHDVRLRLDLDEPAHLALLRAHLDRDHAAVLIEAPRREAYGWAEGRAHEIVLPLAAQTPPPDRSLLPAPAPDPVRPIHHPGHPPGASPWMYARLHAHPDRQTDILTSHLPDLLVSWQEGPVDDWWFLRHHTPDHHLRLRLRLHDPGKYGDAAHRVGFWADQLRERGLLRHLALDTYYPEPGRYGTGDALAAAESVFAADSAAALAQLSAAVPGQTTLTAVTAASILDLAVTFTGSLDAGTAWLTTRVHRHPAPPIDRALYDETMRLADPAGCWAALQVLPGGSEILHAWQARRWALSAYRVHLATQRPNPDAVLAALLHLHHARMVGLEHASERLCLRLARAAALAYKHQTAG